MGFETGTSEDDWVVVSGNAVGLETGDVQKELKVEFFSPSEYWTDALPVGNGRLGAMVWGGVQSDLLQLNGTFYCHFDLNPFLFFSVENAYHICVIAPVFHSLSHRLVLFLHSQKNREKQ